MSYLGTEEALAGAGLPRDEVEQWASSAPAPCAAEEFGRDAQAASAFWSRGAGLLARLPSRARRTEQEQAAAGALFDAQRQVRGAFLRVHAGALYDLLTDTRRRPVRVEQLVYDAADAVPGLVPTRAEVLAEREHPQRDKEGLEIDQGVLLSHVLAHPTSGAHLVYAMLRPTREALERRSEFERAGRVDLGGVSVERRGAIGYLLLGNPRFLNAEDETTVAELETGTDLLLLDPRVEVCVLRGKPVEHPKYAGRRVFNAGINLTRLYYGQIGFVSFYVMRDLGYVHKMWRGLSGPEHQPGAIEDYLEKPWIAAVETFAIGGGCQLLLVMDYVLAERSSYFSLPARKEGIIPGLAPMRLWRLLGDRLARQAILFDRQLAADSPAGQLICDELVPDGAMDNALDRVLAALSGSGMVSAASNRKAIRLGQESLDQFRQYMAMYCREQALCHFSPQLISNLERHWRAHERRL